MQRIKLANDYLKLKNDVAEFTAILTNQFLKNDSPTIRPVLGAIVESDKFQELINQTK